MQGHWLQRPPLAAARLAIGLSQGVFLWLLDRAFLAKQWPATDEMFFSPLLTTALFLPPIAIAGIGDLRVRTLLLWLAGAFILCVGLGWYSAFRELPVPLDQRMPSPWFKLNTFLIGFFFVLHALVSAADADRRMVAGPSSYFEATWKLATQMAFAGLLVGLLMAVLSLGGKLFALINIDFWTSVTSRNWFWIPITTLTVSLSFHLVDRYFATFRGAIVTSLGLISSLLFVVVPMTVAFLVALPFVGFAVLWNAAYATSSLVGVSVVLIVLINCHFRDGDSNLPKAITYFRYVATFLVAPLFAVSVFGWTTQVQQHGWTPLLIVGLGCLTVQTVFAGGYLMTAIHGGLSLDGLARANACAAFSAVAVSLALLTPLADPARLYVADQMRLLEAFRHRETHPAEPWIFSYQKLRIHGAGYGWAALERLKNMRDGPQASEIAAEAARALAKQ